MSQVLTNKLIQGRRVSLKCSNHLFRHYQSQTGVYGYKPRSAQHIQVPTEVLTARKDQSNFYRLVTAYRDHGHRQANINPVAIHGASLVQELDPERYGLLSSDQISTQGIIAGQITETSISDIVKYLQDLYCGQISAEFNYIENEGERDWFAKTYEESISSTLSTDTKKVIASEMLRSQAFDKFMANKFATVKRYGAEGAETMMGFFHEIFRLAAQDDLKQIVLCMPHRGRLNLLTGMLNFPPVALFHKLQGNCEFPDTAQTTGDVISHLTSSTDFEIEGKSLHMTMLICPSHLEAVNPVAMGKTRARQQTLGDGSYSLDENRQWSDLVLNLQVHGDAAFAGQGVNQETLNLASVPHFEIGGSVHLIVNNQIGFTTPGDRGRSSRYTSDLAKMVGAPVIHVNGDNPEMLLKATDIAFRYQRQFRKDIFIDLNCFRRWGHNELDDPTFTNPALYKIIQNRKSIPDSYAEQLAGEGVLSKEEADGISKQHAEWLNEQLKQVDTYQPPESYLKNQWSDIIQAPASVSTWDTGVDQDLLKYVGHRSVSFPDDFAVHPHLLKTHIQGRIRKLQDGADLDWATAEALAFGSLLHQGYNVRISGQDVGRGTFSHRHAMLVSQDTNEMYIPLNNLESQKQGYFEVANSILSEEAVLGFEYGMSVESPNRLTIWEAQFGDFFNGAQIQIDTFVTCGETKWVLCSGLVMLLPHGYDGAGPEHSSCRLERFLQLTDSSEVKPDGDNVNFQVVYPTTPAQYFHLLRRQMVRNFRKPLVVAGPKTLLRLPAASSKLSQMAPGTFFHPVIGDAEVSAENVTSVVLCSGKHFYNLLSQRETLGRKDVALVRVEALSPFPTMELNKELARFPKARSFIWSQEEPRNMGAWSFVSPRFQNLVGRKLKYRGRPTLPCPAVGYGKAHQQQAKEVIVLPFAP